MLDYHCSNCSSVFFQNLTLPLKPPKSEDFKTWHVTLAVGSFEQNGLASAWSVVIPTPGLASVKHKNQMVASCGQIASLFSLFNGLFKGRERL